MTLYPLTAAQKVYLGSIRRAPDLPILNIGASMLFRLDMDFDCLREAIYRTYERNEALRIRFMKTYKGVVYQYIAEKEIRPIEFCDFSDKSDEEVDSILQGWTKVPFQRFNSPMNRIVMLKCKDGYCGIYLLIDHMTADSSGIFAIAGDLVEIYCALKFGTEYPKEMQSYIKAVEKDLKYEEGSAQKERDAEFWRRYYMESEPIFTDITGTGLQASRDELNNPNLRASKFSARDITAAHKIFHLEPHPTQELIDYCQRYRIPMVSLIMMGVRTYLSKMNNNEKDISIKSTIDRRGTLLAKKSGGTRVHFFPCRTVIEDSDTFLEGIKKIQHAQNAIFKHADYDPVELMQGCQESFGHEAGFGHEGLTLTYQPLSLKPSDSRLSGLDYKCKWYSSGICGQALYVTVMHNADDNGLDFYFEYQSSIITEKQLQDMYYYVCKIIFMGIQNENMTVGEILHTV